MLRRFAKNALQLAILAGVVLIVTQVWTYNLGVCYRKVDGQWMWGGDIRLLGIIPVTTIAHKFDSDAKSFVVLDDPKYGKDRLRVFYEGRPIVDADPASFVTIPTQRQHVRASYAKDNVRVFLEGYLIPQADPNSFEIFDSLYARDKTRVYCGTVAMEGADPATFEVMRQGSGFGTAFVKDITMDLDPDFADREVSQSQPAITSLNSWARDARRHYREAWVIRGADYETFHAVDPPPGVHLAADGRDKDHEYIMTLRKEDFVREWQRRYGARNAIQQQNQNRNEGE